MKKLIILLSITVLLFFRIDRTNAQAQTIGVSSFQVQDTTLFTGDTLLIFGNIYNYDSVDFFDGNVYFKVKLNGVDIDSADINLIQDTAYYSIPPLSSKSFILKILIIFPKFQVGPNVVIIWPKSDWNTKDSINCRILVDYPLGTNDLNSNFDINASLTEQGVEIPENGNILLNRVRIYNIIGNLIAESSLEKTNMLQFENKPNQIYLCEFIYNSNKRKVMKLVRY